MDHGSKKKNRGRIYLQRDKIRTYELLSLWLIACSGEPKFNKPGRRNISRFSDTIQFRIFLNGYSCDIVPSCVTHSLSLSWLTKSASRHFKHHALFSVGPYSTETTETRPQPFHRSESSNSVVAYGVAARIAFFELLDAGAKVAWWSFGVFVGHSACLRVVSGMPQGRLWTGGICCTMTR